MQEERYKNNFNKLKTMKYTIKNLHSEFSTDKKCLQFIFDNRYGKKFECPDCKKTGKFYLIESRKRFDCTCGYTISPLADTIFHKSSTPLTLWFHAIFLFASSRNGVAAKELERQLGVTYKCAWRLAKQIRLLFSQTNFPLSGTVETDETYVGGKRKGKRGLGAEGKTPVFGMIEREGKAVGHVISDVKMKTLQPLINKSIIKDSIIMTDELRSYSRIAQNGYRYESVKHGTGEFVRGQVHTNNIEGFWSQMKRSINGTYHLISPKYLQNYVNEFIWRYNFRSESLFPLMILRAVKPILTTL